MLRLPEHGRIDVFYGAPTIILVLAEKGVGNPVEDGSLCLGNMFNAAYALGLGSRWIQPESGRHLRQN